MMIKLINLLKEIYVDKQGNLIGDAEFIVKQTGYFDLILVDKSKINLNEYIHFQSKYSKWNKTKISNTIFNQVVELYKGTALEKYNNNIGFDPTKAISKGSGLDVPSLYMTFMKGISEVENDTWKGWLLPPLYVETPIDKEEYTLEGRTFPGFPGFIDGPIDMGPGEKAKITLSNNSEESDINNKLAYLDITFIPFVEVPSYTKGKPDIIIDKKTELINVFNNAGLDALSKI
jgi:hypothetical protein